MPLIYKKCWTFIKKKYIPDVKSQGQIYSENIKKTEILNEQFQSVFTHEDPLDNPHSSQNPMNADYGNHPRRNVKTVEGFRPG